ncbi:DUF1801 domain-containing protein [Candidatus Saccharibacteria bacterium]|nr:DUF1801 domain-containing protein [Candidatus Saccharibacteria bacterium]
MNVFSGFIKSLQPIQRLVFQHYIKIIPESVPEVTEGLSYGMPAFKYKSRPLIGFGSNKHGLSIYPFDPRVIEDLKTELKDFETSKGTIRFTADNPVPDELIILIVDTRLSYLNG